MKKSKKLFENFSEMKKTNLIALGNKAMRNVTGGLFIFTTRTTITSTGPAFGICDCNAGCGCSGDNATYSSENASNNKVAIDKTAYPG